MSLRVAFVSSDPDSASARVRVVDRLPGLRALGIDGELVALPKGLRARRRLFATLRAHDLVVLQRRLLDPLSLASLRGAARRLVLDLDDAIWERPFRARSLRNRLRFVRLLRRVDLVIAGSAWLRDQVAARHPRVRLVRPAPPPPACDALPDPDRKRLVWTGSRATLPYLESLAPVLAELSARIPGLVVDVVADQRPRLPGVEVAFTPWSLEAEPRVVARAHVGLYPLLDDPWSRGKCAYKVLLYMSLGVPSVASPQGAGAEALSAGGLLASSPAEWLSALEGLLVDEPRRQALAHAACALSASRDAPAQRSQELAEVLREAARLR